MSAGVVIGVDSGCESWHAIAVDEQLNLRTAADYSGGLLQHLGIETPSLAALGKQPAPQRVLALVIEWPQIQSYERAKARHNGESVYEAVLATATRARQHYGHLAEIVYCPDANQIRRELCAYSPRRDGPADKFINHWLCGRRPRGSCRLNPAGLNNQDAPGRIPLYLTGKGTMLNSAHLRDALIAALWGIRTLRLFGGSAALRGGESRRAS